MHMRFMNRAESRRMPVIGEQLSAIQIFDRVQIHPHDCFISKPSGRFEMLNHGVFGSDFELDVWRPVRSPQHQRIRGHVLIRNDKEIAR